MKKYLRALLLDDSDENTGRVIQMLKRNGYDLQSQRVDTFEKFKDALSEKMWDVILSNYSNEKLNSKSALKFLQQNELDIPFIVLSTDIGDEKAVSIIKQGANNYVNWKNIKKLHVIIQQELIEAKLRHDNNWLVTQIVRAKLEWEATVDATDDIFIVTDLEGKIIRLNRAAIEFFEATYIDLLGTWLSELFVEIVVVDIDARPLNGEYRFKEIEGIFLVRSHPIIVEEDYFGIVVVITERK